MKDFYVKVRLNEDEKKILVKYALENGMTATDYVKYCCITNKPKLSISNSLLTSSSTDIITNEELLPLISGLISRRPVGSNFTIKEL